MEPASNESMAGSAADTTAAVASSSPPDSGTAIFGATKPSAVTPTAPQPEVLDLQPQTKEPPNNNKKDATTATAGLTGAQEQSQVTSQVSGGSEPSLVHKEAPSTPEESHHEWVSMDVDKFGKSFYNSDSSPLNEQIRSLKLKTLTEYLNNGMVDEIVEYSRSTDGLISNELRRKIWPLLLGVSAGKAQSSIFTSPVASTFLDDLNVADFPAHSDEDQVKLDIKRSFTILNHLQSFATSFTSIYSKEEISLLKKHLYNLVVKILRKYPDLHYYQGYHDIASIVLIICYDPTSGTIDEPLSFRLLETLTLHRLRDYMVSDIHLSLVHLRLIPAVLEIVDHRFFKLIKHTSNTYVASDGTYYDYGFLQGLSSVLTMFSHDIDNLHQLLTVWDFSFSYNSVLITIYIYVAALVFRKHSIFKELGIKDDTDFAAVDRDLLHNLVSPSSLFANLADSDLIQILNSAKSLYETYPITKLSNSSYTFDLWFRQHNESSVLNTLGAGDPGSDALNATGSDTSGATGSNATDFPSLVDDPAAVSQVLKAQDEEIAKLVLYDMANERAVFDELEADTTDYETSTSTGNSLASSLSSLQSSTSNLNSKILRSSSIYFKKIFSDGGSDGEKKKKASFFRLTTIYKISLTVGFLGFLLHFLLTRHHNVLSLNMFKVSNITGLFNVGLRSGI